MKRIVLILLAGIGLASCSSTYKSYPIEYSPNDINKTTFYYSVPTSSEVVFDVTFIKTIRQKGVFANQSNLLGVKNVITEDEVKYEVKDIKISSQAKTSPVQQFALILNSDKVNVMQSPQGTLESINFVERKHRPKPQFNLNIEQESEPNIISQKTIEPIQTSIAAKPIFENLLQQKGMLEKVNFTAADAVKKIEQLRERQIEILSGGLEGTYINTTVDYMYKQLDEIIDGYVALFTGTETIVEETRTFTLTPQKPIIAEEDLVLPLKNSPIPLLARFHTNNQTEFFKKNAIKMINQNPPSEINISEIKVEGIEGVYRAVPELVSVSVETPNKTFSNKVEINQYGLIKAITTRNKNIEFNPNTGVIKRIR